MKNFWENPEVQQINRLPARSPLLPFDSMARAASECADGPESCAQTKSPRVKSLDGKWKFALLDSPCADERGKFSRWTRRDFKSKLWRRINVPGTWTLQGFGAPHYTNIQMPFDTLPPNVPAQNQTGLYRIDTEIPAEWKGRRVVLHIGSAESCALVYVNGKFAGASKDSRLPCEFDITSLLSWREDSCVAAICVKVVRWSDGSFLEDQDEWWFGGIQRSVYLYSTESRFIQDVEALTQVQRRDDGKHDGIIPLNARIGFAREGKDSPLSQSEAARMNVAVKYKVFRLDGTPARARLGRVVAQGEAAGSYDYRANLNTISARIKIGGVRLWSSETPSLYVVALSLCEAGKKGTAGRAIESVAFTVGFKTVEVSNRELLINGKKVYIHGVNRHEHNERRGKTLSTEEMLRDIKILKSRNFNAVRTSHYPNDERWYELCDRYGIYLMDEANIECHAYYDCLARSDSWSGAFMSRVQRMVRRDKNHASIFCWSLGNESGAGANQAIESAWIRQADKTRVIHYEGFARPERAQGAYTLETLAQWKDFVDLVSPMYPSIDLISEYAKKSGDPRPLVMCEYSHAMGNSNGSLSDYWEAIEAHHGLQGGFIWDYIDQGIAAEMRRGENHSPQGGKYWKYGGDFGDFPNDHDFCLNGLVLPDGTPKPAMEECRHLFAPVRAKAIDAPRGLFEIENRRDFTDLGDISLAWKILKNGAAVKRRKAALPKCAPGGRVRVKIPEVRSIVTRAKKRGEEIAVVLEFVYSRETAFAPAGTLVRADSFIVSRAKGWQNFEGGESRAEGLSKAARAVAENFRPALFHAIIENEGIKAEIPQIGSGAKWNSFTGKPTELWLQSGLNNMLVVPKRGGGMALVSPANAKIKKKFGTCEISVKNCRAPSGRPALQIDVTLSLSSALAEYPRAGVRVPISASLKTARWYGRGPHECCCDRKAGAPIGMHEMAVDALGTPYIVPQENGSRCDTRYLELRGETQSVHIQSLSPFCFNVSKYSAQNLFACAHTAELSDLSKDRRNPRFILSIDAAHRGVGTGACGPDTLEKYRVKPGVYKLSLRVW